MKKALLFFTFIFAFGLTNAQQTGYFTTQFSWTNTDGLQTRSLRAYVPVNYDSTKSYTLVIGFHGLGGAPNTYIQSIIYYATNPYFGNVILVCPSEGSASTSWFAGDEDLKIISAIINKMKGTYNIDLNRVFAQGFSFGGKSAYLLGLDEADLLKGIIAHSPGFYSTKDVYNTCTNPQHCQHKYNYANAWKVVVSITAGSGEYNLGLTEPYLVLAQKAVAKLNLSGGNAKFFEDPTGYHNLPPLSIVKQCWTFVNKSTVAIEEKSEKQAFRIFPNPANDKVYCEAEIAQTNSTIMIYNVTGVLVKKMEFNGNNTSIAVDKLVSGIYFIKVFNKKKGWIYKDKIVISR